MQAPAVRGRPTTDGRSAAATDTAPPPPRRGRRRSVTASTACSSPACAVAIPGLLLVVAWLIGRSAWPAIQRGRPRAAGRPDVGRRPRAVRRAAGDPRHARLVGARAAHGDAARARCRDLHDGARAGTAPAPRGLPGGRRWPPSPASCTASGRSTCSCPSCANA